MLSASAIVNFTNTDPKANVNDVLKGIVYINDVGHLLLLLVESLKQIFVREIHMNKVHLPAYDN